MLTNNIRSAFDGIRAENKLKTDTIRFLQREIERRAKARVSFRRYAVALASAVVLLLTGIFAHGIYFTPIAYVDLDVNPSIELTLNRFDRVIETWAYNEDGYDVIESLSLTHKNYNDALTSLMDAMTQQGYLEDGGLVSVTLQTYDESKEIDLLSGIQSGVEFYMENRHHTAQIDVFPVSGDTRRCSSEQGISPAKYLAIQELIEADPTATIENCRDHSISEIRRMTRAHGNHHGDDVSDAANENIPAPTQDGDETAPSGQGSNHHAQGDGGRRHGNTH